MPNQKNTVKDSQITAVDGNIHIGDILQATPVHERYKYKRANRDNEVFKQFLFLDRNQWATRLENHCRALHAGQEGVHTIYQIKALACHQGDWLFDRLYLELKNDEEFSCEYYDKIMISTQRLFSDFKRDTFNKYKRYFPNNQNFTTGQDLLQLLPDNKFHLLPFVIDAPNDNDELDLFIAQFYDFWGNNLSNKHYLILLAVNLNKKTKKSWWAKWTNKTVKKTPNSPQMDDLCAICTHDIDSFFRYKMELPQYCKRIQNEIPIDSLWGAFFDLLCE